MSKIFTAFLIVLAFITGVAAGNTFVGGHPCNWAMNEPLPIELKVGYKRNTFKDWCLAAKMEK